MMLKSLFYDFYSPLAPLNQRIFLIDFLRFMAIALMVYFHLYYDLNMLGFVQVEIMKGFWFYLPRVIVTLFLLSSGLSLNLSTKDQSLKQNFSLMLPRFIKLAFFAVIISLITKFMFPSNWVYFGTLHCLAALSLVACLFRGKSLWPFILGIIIQLNYFLDIVPMMDPMDLIKIKSIDYIPLYPWVGVFLIGMGLAKPLKSSKVAQLVPPGGQFISIVSQKSLPLYLLHQPLIFSSLWVLKKML